MAKLEVRIEVSTGTCRLALNLARVLLWVGVPPWFAFHVMRYLMWVRVKAPRQNPWRGWVWLGRGLDIDYARS